jgi:hypothetical protein
VTWRSFGGAVAAVAGGVRLARLNIRFRGTATVD